MKLWHYIERHHDDFGVCLFVLPVLLGTFALLGAVSAVVRWF